jgi:class 3 adenylate cyclase
MLAAIVFTDVVGFSARMQEDETATLALLERDFAMMRTLCAKHEGSVLKTTGDGLLLYFSSAVLAVAYAQKMQRYFAETAKAQPGDDALVHRVGVHLGDVFVNNQDVMGDGVNIAARLQAEAEPGGICISQTVYDVVKNKLELEVVKLGPRELKNISDAMPIYRILLEPPKRSLAATGQPVRSFTPAAQPAAPTFSNTQKVMVVVVLALALGFGARQILQAQREHEEQLKESRLGVAALDAVLAEKARKPDPGAKEPVVPAPGAGGAAVRPNDAAKPEEYDFAAMVRRQSGEKDGPARTDEWVRQQAAQRLPALFGWLNTALQRYGKDNPLVAHEKNGTIVKEIRVFTGPDRKIYFAEGGAIRQRNWTNLSPATTGAIVVDAMEDAAGSLPPEVMEGAEAFAHYYDLPVMKEELRKLRVRRTLQ